MKLSRKSEYACLALLDLTEHYDKGVRKIEDISNSRNIPKKYLEQILLLLKGAGYVKSRRGYSGGYLLSKPPEEINIAQIIRLIDGHLAPVESASKLFYGESPIEQSPELLNIFKDIRDYIANKLENTTFADIIEK
jgi:Rrf2 family cysteine metabolism transcriptional repressor